MRQTPKPKPSPIEAARTSAMATINTLETLSTVKMNGPRPTLQELRDGIQPIGRELNANCEAIVRRLAVDVRTLDQLLPPIEPMLKGDVLTVKTPRLGTGTFTDRSYTAIALKLARAVLEQIQKPSESALPDKTCTAAIGIRNLWEISPEKLRLHVEVEFDRAAAKEKNEWSREASPADIRKALGISLTTLKDRIQTGHIQREVVHTKLWRIRMEAASRLASRLRSSNGF